MSLDPGLDRSRLPRGTHGLDRSAVESSQRGRLHYAVLEAVSEFGYTATTVAHIVARANVSRRTFYQFYRDRDDCFADAFTAATEFAIINLDLAVAGADRGEWRALLRTTLTAYLHLLADNSSCAQALHVECLVAGPVVAQQRMAVKATLADRMRAVFRIGRRCGDIPVDIPAGAFDAVIGAIDDRIRDCLNGPGSAALPDQAALLYRITLALFGVPDWER
ncbi:TetR/AcrR family transcriptional regulator [Nocardia pseudobrasiliensis]|uniref:TetR family transcriptional regulator n=1 Tax=Nocardia pseudobrasiliensis TaxID=45979 RepID=A0A370I3G9_9NOCA|nr:TetR/AcrR family transcriptional regulator [Nocardia pseudobrasiliensis]RDI63854.1 TetR family transcriptional regulator [Nocardia pseudobrasiliensis]